MGDCIDFPYLENLICEDCGAILTEEERHYYEKRCEGCEQEWAERIDAWRHGGEDAELDAMFDGPSTPDKQ